ncbi:MAG: translation elongation factor Ts [Candidatus Paceibacterota bacterium]|jgi:elongation factor Ts
MISTEQIKELRERTGISISQCKKSLEEAGGDMDKALDLLRAKGTEIANKKAARSLQAGTVACYLHNTGTVGAMVQVNAETDFVSKNAEFKILADDLAMHIAAMSPIDVPELLAQPFIKEPSLTIDALIKQYTQKFGERIDITRFSRFDSAEEIAENVNLG